jgi:hypothetical protein
MASKSTHTIRIISGEGCGEGTIEDFSGTQTKRAVWGRLKQERCGGDRWAFAEIDGVRCDTIADLDLAL